AVITEDRGARCDTTRCANPHFLQPSNCVVLGNTPPSTCVVSKESSGRSIRILLLSDPVETVITEGGDNTSWISDKAGVIGITATQCTAARSVRKRKSAGCGVSRVSGLGNSKRGQTRERIIRIRTAQQGGTLIDRQ